MKPETSPSSFGCIKLFTPYYFGNDSARSRKKLGDLEPRCRRSDQFTITSRSEKGRVIANEAGDLVCIENDEEEEEDYERTSKRARGSDSITIRRSIETSEETVNSPTLIPGYTYTQDSNGLHQISQVMDSFSY